MTITYSNDFNVQAIGEAVGPEYNEAWTKTPFEIFGLVGTSKEDIWLEPYVSTRRDSSIDTLTNWLKFNALTVAVNQQEEEKKLFIGLRRDMRKNISYCAALVKTMVGILEGKNHIDFNFSLPPYKKHDPRYFMSNGKLIGLLRNGDKVKVKGASSYRAESMGVKLVTGAVSTIRDTYEGGVYLNLEKMPPGTPDFCYRRCDLEFIERVPPPPPPPAPSFSLAVSSNRYRPADVPLANPRIGNPGAALPLGMRPSCGLMPCAECDISYDRTTSLSVGSRVVVTSIPGVGPDDDGFSEIVGREFTVRSMFNTDQYYLMNDGFDYYYNRADLAFIAGSDAGVIAETPTATSAPHRPVGSGNGGSGGGIYRVGSWSIPAAGDSVTITAINGLTTDNTNNGAF